MLKIFQARVQQYVNYEFPDVEAGFWKGRRTRDQIANIYWVIKKARDFQSTYFCFIDYAKDFDSVDHNSSFSQSVVFDLLQPHGLQHARLPCPSPTPGA